MKRLLLFPVIVCGFVACNSSDANNNADYSDAMTPVITDSAKAAAMKTANETGQLPALPVTTLPSKVGKINPNHGQPGHRCDIPDGAPIPDGAQALLPAAGIQPPAPVTSPAVTPQPASMPQGIALPGTTPAQSTTTAAGTNPPHGQPGHKCESDASLQTKAGNAAPPTVQPAQPLPQPVQTTTATATKAGMNPPHGQPGHKCELAVGAPLDGKAAPATNTVTPVQAQSATAAQVLPPALTKDNNGVALNPAHGQPGHDCSIEVGKPLKKQ